jgi:hypothetical protein
MDIGKLRRGELIAAAGGLLLLIALFFFDWYSLSVTIPLGSTSTSFGAWDSEGFFGFIANLVILAAAVAAVGLAIVTATSRTIALPVAASALTASLGIAAVGMVLLRMIFQPGPNALVDIKFGIVLALIASVVVAYGGWDSMQEEGTTFDHARDQLQSRYARRPAPESSTAPPSESRPSQQDEGGSPEQEVGGPPPPP